MKVVQQEIKFQPVTITLETQDELDILIAALNNSPSELRGLWFNLGEGGELNTSKSYDMFHQLYALTQFKGETK